jgi:hypothetical protein
MAVKNLSAVKVGSLVNIRGNHYEVVKNKITSLDLRRTGTICNSSDFGVISATAQVNVIAEPSVVVAPGNQGARNLADTLRKQVAKQSLTESLRSQATLPAVPGFTPVHAECYATLQQQPVVDGKARFENQVTRAGLSQAKNDIAELQSQIQEIQDEYPGDFEGFQEEFEDFKEEVEEDITDIREDIYGIGSDVRSLSHRVVQIEQKERKAVFQNNVQAQLNAKLAEKQNSEKTTGGINVNNVLGQFKGLFGKVEGQFALAATGGIAMRKGISNEFVTYNKATGQITDVTSFTLDFKVPAFRLPVEAKDIKVGDIVLNNNDYGYVIEVIENGEYVKTIQPAKASQGTVLPVTNFMFGKPFYTVVQTLDAAGQGGFNPALLLAMGDGKKDDILPFLLMSGGLGGNANGAAAGGIDPMTLMMLGDNTEELLPFLLMQQGGVAKEGFNPLMLLAMSGSKGKGGSKKDNLLPLLAMSGGFGGAQGQAGGINPMMLMALSNGDSDIDPMTLMMMSGGFGGQQAGGGLFGSVPTPAKKDDSAE